MRRFFHNAIKSDTEFREMGIIRKILYIVIDVPMDFLRRLTIACPADDMWFRPFAVCFPFFMTLFTFLSTDLWPIADELAPPLSWYICQGVSLVICVIMYFITERDHPPRWSIILSMIALLGSILWLEFISDIMVDLLGLIALMAGIDPAYLGITFLAMGNSVGDMVANYGVSKRGLANMAIVGCFAGPLFNMCLGLGLSMLRDGIIA